MPDQPTPASVQDCLGASGEPPSFDWRGKTYKIGWPVSRVQGRFEELIRRAETAAVMSLKGIVPEEDYHELLADLGRQVRRREHRTRDGKLWQKYVTGPERATGFALFLLAALREYHPDVTEADVETMLGESREAVLLCADVVCPGFFTWVGGLLGWPPEVVAGGIRATREGLLAVAATLPAPTTPPPSSPPSAASPGV